MKVENTAIRLNTLMEERNLRQVDILEKCKPYCKQYNIKLGRNDLSQYVNGKVEPGQEKLSVLGLALNVSEAGFMGEDVPQERTRFIVTNHEEVGDEVLQSISTLAKECGFEFSIFANQAQIVFNDCIVKLSPKELSDLITASIDQIHFIFKTIIDNKLRNNIISIRSDLKIDSESTANYVNAARDEDYAGATEELPEAPQYAKQEVPDYLTVKAAHNDAEITDEELEKMERDSMLIREMVKKQKR